MWRIELFEHKLRLQNEPTSTAALDQNRCSKINETTQANGARLEAAEPLLDGLPVPILKIDADGQVGYANTPAKKLLNFPESDPPPLYDLVEGMGRPIAEWLSDAAQGRGLVKTEFVRATRADRELFIQISLGRIEENGHTRLLGILNDATELKTLEAQFVQIQRQAALVLEWTRFYRWTRQQHVLVRIAISAQPGKALLQVIQAVNTPVPLLAIVEHGTGVMLERCLALGACSHPRLALVVSGTAQSGCQRVQARLVA